MEKPSTKKDGDGIEPGETSAKYELLTQLRKNAQPEDQQRKIADLDRAIVAVKPPYGGSPLPAGPEC